MPGNPGDASGVLDVCLVLAVAGAGSGWCWQWLVLEVFGFVA
ncbi:MAG: hypothetical protein ACK6D4_16875 [Planctomyces sp.]